MNRIGLIAGNGRFPLLIAEEIKKNGDQTVAISYHEETDPALEQLVEKTAWLPLGKLQKIIDFFHEEKVTVAIMAGQIKHSHLFANLAFDLRAIKLLGRIKNKKTDSILGAVADELKSEGIELLPSHLYLKHLIPEPGILTGPKLSKDEKADIEFGYGVAKQIAGLDIGQTVVVKDRAVIAVESMEGTDECIKRAATFSKEGIIVAKVAKPNQDFRFDIPVIGPKTVALMIEHKARALVIDAGATLMIDKNEILASAGNNGLTIIAM